MGPLELRTYRLLWRAAAKFRRQVRQAASERPVACSEKSDTTVARHNDDLEVDGKTGPRRSLAVPFSPSRIIAGLLLARVFDSKPCLRQQLQTAAPVILIDVPDSHMLDRVTAIWKDTLFDGQARLADLAYDCLRPRQEIDAFCLVATAPPKATVKTALEAKTLSMLGYALPVVAISPSSRQHLPEAINKAATTRLDFPKPDITVVESAIRIVTGRPCRALLATETLARATLADLEVAIRFDRTPSECVAEIRRLVAAADATRKPRDLKLSELHGMDEARTWAQATIADIRAWRAGDIGWESISSGIALCGPPGCGKTTFAAVFAAEAGLHFVAATLAKWQGAGEAHLGHLLRAMAADFQEARARPSCLFIDEIDSFPERSTVRHVHRDYVVEVVNALLAEIDGIAGREGVIVIGASNDLSRCEPALLRSGRLEHVVRIGLPSIAELAKMFRVRLQGDLPGDDLSAIAELAVGMTGADIERVVKDARRTARHQQRALTIENLRNTLLGRDNRSPSQRWRHCVHEAGHVLLEVLHFGPSNLFASVRVANGRGGLSMRTGDQPAIGSWSEWRKKLEIALAGRAAEELLLGEVSACAGGAGGSDLDKATALAAAMVGSLGMTSRLAFLGPASTVQDFLKNPDTRESVERELEQAAIACKCILDRHRASLQRVASQLSENERVEGTDVAAIVERLDGSTHT
jgi:cell division protease FtsH